jgi:hypothetical protein
MPSEKITISRERYKRLLKYKELAETYLNIAKCKLCGSPHPEEYICCFCGEDDSDPEGYVAEVQES